MGGILFPKLILKDYFHYEKKQRQCFSLPAFYMGRLFQRVEREVGHQMFPPPGLRGYSNGCRARILVGLGRDVFISHIDVEELLLWVARRGKEKNFNLRS